MLPIRVLEYTLLAITLLSVTLSVLLVADAFRDVIYRGTTDGLAETVARSHLRLESYGFFVQIAFLVVSVSFVSSPVPDPLPPGTLERVGFVTLGAVVILVQSLDAYLTKRVLLRRV